MILEGADIVQRRSAAAADARILLDAGDRAGLVGGRLHLSHKGRDERAASVTEFVTRQPDEIIKSWRAELNLCADIDRPFAGHTIVVEDASPDTCLALIALSLRLRGEQLDDRWIDYSRRWELGYVDSTGAPKESFGALLSALAHVELQDFADEDRNIASAAHRRALNAAVTYSEGLIALELDPANLPRVLQNASDDLHALHGQAHSRLAFEEITYRRLKTSATKIQLAVHLARTGRKTLVDAIFFRERTLTTSLKSFIRTDPDTFTGNGYAFQALYRPALKMSGYDITISTNPAARLDLWELWRELEKLEEERWAQFALQPDGFPRPRGERGDVSDRVLPSHGESWSVTPPCHQPWYDEMGRRTLIAGPREVYHNGAAAPGSLLSWADVKNVIWRVYAPTFGLRLRAPGTTGEGCRLTDDIAKTAELRRELLPGLDLHAVVAARVEGQPEDVSLWSPTLSAACAAFIETGQTSIDALASPESYDVVEARGGVAVVSESGLMLVDMDCIGDFPFEMALAAATRVATKVKLAADLEATISGPLRDLVEEAISRGTEEAKRNALKSIFRKKFSARRVWRDAQNLEADPLVRQLRELCESRWRARERLQAAMTEINELEQMVVSSSELQANAVLDKLAMIGFPLSLAGNVLGGLIVLDNGTYKGISAPILAGYALIASGLALLVYIYARQQRSQWKWSGDDAGGDS